MAYFGENWDWADFPLAYLITIRTYGTWLHGDERFSVDTHDNFNVYGLPKRQTNLNLQATMIENMKAPSVKFDRKQRLIVEAAIKEVCQHRGYTLYAQNVRSNHGHVVVGAEVKPEVIANSFKAYATRKLREHGWFENGVKPWSRGRSRRYLWKGKHLNAAIDYVLYCQGDDVFEDWYAAKYKD